MPGEELNDKTIVDLMVTGGTGAALAICFQIIRKGFILCYRLRIQIQYSRYNRLQLFQFHFCTLL